MSNTYQYYLQQLQAMYGAPAAAEEPVEGSSPEPPETQIRNDLAVNSNLLPRICGRVINIFPSPLRKILAKVSNKVRKFRHPREEPQDESQEAVQKLDLAAAYPDWNINTEEGSSFSSGPYYDLNAVQYLPDNLIDIENNITVKTLYELATDQEPHKMMVKQLFVLELPALNKVGDPAAPIEKMYFDTLAEAQDMAQFFAESRTEVEKKAIEIVFGNISINEMFENGRVFIKEACKDYLLGSLDTAITPDPKFILKVFEMCPVSLTITEVALAGLILRRLDRELMLAYRNIPDMRRALNGTLPYPKMTHDETKWMFAGRHLILSAIFLAVGWEDDEHMAVQTTDYQPINVPIWLLNLTTHWLLGLFDWNMFPFQRDGKIEKAVAVIKIIETQLLKDREAEQTRDLRERDLEGLQQEAERQREGSVTSNTPALAFLPASVTSEPLVPDPAIASNTTTAIPMAPAATTTSNSASTPTFAPVSASAASLVDVPASKPASTSVLPPGPVSAPRPVSKAVAKSPVAPLLILPADLVLPEHPERRRPVEL